MNESNNDNRESVDRSNVEEIGKCELPPVDVKNPSFQIKSIVVDTNCNDFGDDSTDDSHGEEIKPPFSFAGESDRVFYNSITNLSEAPVIPTSAQYGLALVSDLELAKDLQSDTSGVITQSDIDINALRSERFKVVKIESSEPFRRGRWVCMDFQDHAMAESYSPLVELKKSAEVDETAKQPANCENFVNADAVGNALSNLVESSQNESEGTVLVNGEKSSFNQSDLAHSCNIPQNVSASNNSANPSQVPVLSNEVPLFNGPVSNSLQGQSLSQIAPQIQPQPVANAGYNQGQSLPQQQLQHLISNNYHNFQNVQPPQQSPHQYVPIQQPSIGQQNLLTQAMQPGQQLPPQQVPVQQQALQQQVVQQQSHTIQQNQPPNVQQMQHSLMQQALQQPTHLHQHQQQQTQPLSQQQSIPNQQPVPQMQQQPPSQHNIPQQQLPLSQTSIIQQPQNIQQSNVAQQANVQQQPQSISQQQTHQIQQQAQSLSHQQSQPHQLQQQSPQSGPAQTIPPSMQSQILQQNQQQASFQQQPPHHLHQQTLQSQLQPLLQPMLQSQSQTPMQQPLMQQQSHGQPQMLPSQSAQSVYHNQQNTNQMSSQQMAGSMPAQTYQQNISSQSQPVSQNQYMMQQAPQQNMQNIMQQPMQVPIQQQQQQYSQYAVSNQPMQQPVSMMNPQQQFVPQCMPAQLPVQGQHNNMQPIMQSMAQPNLIVQQPPTSVSQPMTSTSQSSQSNPSMSDSTNQAMSQQMLHEVQTQNLVAQLQNSMNQQSLQPQSIGGQQTSIPGGYHMNVQDMAMQSQGQGQMQPNYPPMGNQQMIYAQNVPSGYLELHPAYSSQLKQGYAVGGEGTQKMDTDDANANQAHTDDNESGSAAGSNNHVAIDNKIEQAMDLVKTHLMFAVREEVEVLKEKISELMDRINQLEVENSILKANASAEVIAQLHSTTAKQSQAINQPNSQSSSQQMQSHSQQQSQQPPLNHQSQTSSLQSNPQMNTSQPS